MKTIEISEMRRIEAGLIIVTTSEGAARASSKGKNNWLTSGLVLGIGIAGGLLALFALRSYFNNNNSFNDGSSMFEGLKVRVAAAR